MLRNFLRLLSHLIKVATASGFEPLSLGTIDPRSDVLALRHSHIYCISCTNTYSSCSNRHGCKGVVWYMVPNPCQLRPLRLKHRLVMSQALHLHLHSLNLHSHHLPSGQVSLKKKKDFRMHITLTIFSTSKIRIGFSHCTSKTIIHLVHLFPPV